MEKEINELIRKSYTEIPSADFNEKVMRKIHEEVLREKKIHRNRMLAWLMIGISAVIFPFAVWVLTNENISINLTYIKVSPDPENFMIAISVSFALLLLFLMNKIINDRITG